MNLITGLVGLATFAISILLFLELHTTEGLYTFGYFILGLYGMAVSGMAFYKADALIMMGRNRRKFFLSFLWLL
jgi:hypothetical protein